MPTWDHVFNPFEHEDHVSARVETTGSIWVFQGNRYLRFPRQEGPRIDELGRPRPEWGGPDSGAMADGVWHPYTRRLYVRDGQSVRLVIEYPDSECTAGDKCRGLHFIRTGDVLVPAVDPADATHWWEHEADYLNNRRGTHGPPALPPGHPHTEQ